MFMNVIIGISVDLQFILHVYRLKLMFSYNFINNIIIKKVIIVKFLFKVIMLKAITFMFYIELKSSIKFYIKFNLKNL